eukprot:scaffold7247_cov484-Prasinococcus_capsulatus_cf.AAC.9
MLSWRVHPSLLKPCLQVNDTSRSVTKTRMDTGQVHPTQDTPVSAHAVLANPRESFSTGESRLHGHGAGTEHACYEAQHMSGDQGAYRSLGTCAWLGGRAAVLPLGL